MQFDRASIRQIAGTSAMAIVLIGFPIAKSSASIVDNIGKRIQAVEDSLCQKLKSPKCRSGNGAKKKVTPPAAATPAKKGKSEAKTEIPIPRPNPRRTAAATPAETLETQDTIPIPRAKPTGLGPASKNKEREVASTAITPKKTIALPKGGDCQDNLAFLGVSFAAEAQPASAGSCSVDDPVMLKSMRLASGSVEFPDHPLLNCRFAVEFAKWLEADGAAAAAKAGSPLAKLYTGPGYECRGRNGDASGKISEHGYGNAVDITFFKLRDGSTIQVKDAPVRAAKGYAALAAMRSTACSAFTTVLGPGANAAHAEHFHFDLGKHGKSGTHRICE
jgi:hypothetical protein